MIRNLFRIKSLQDDGLNTIPNSLLKYVWCSVLGHDMEPFNYDVAEPCKRCGIEDDRNCLTPLVGIRPNHYFRHIRYIIGGKTKASS